MQEDRNQQESGYFQYDTFSLLNSENDTNIAEFMKYGNARSVI